MNALTHFLPSVRALALTIVVISAAFNDHVSLAQGTGANQSIQPSQSIEGILTIVWGDPRHGAAFGGETRYALALSDGRILSLHLAGQESTAILNFGKHVTVSGRVVANPPSIQNPRDAGSILVDSITAGQATPSATAVIGTRRVIYLLAKFSDDAAVPHPPVFYTDLNNPDTPPAGEVFPTTVNGFFNKTSWNQFSWVGDVGGMGGVGAPGGWLTLPHPKSYYAPCGWQDSCAGAHLSVLADDATALGRSQGITFTNYDNINFVLSNDLDCCAWGGSYGSAVDNKLYGATWEPPWGQETGTYAHEMGHSIGLPHSGWVYFAYDSPWDTMSGRTAASTVACGSYASINSGGAASTVYCDQPGSGYIAAHKDYLGWIPSVNAGVTDTSASVTVTLEGGALPLTSGIKLLTICISGLPCTGSSARYFTVEARVKGLGATSQFDNAIPGEGVIIHAVQRDRSQIAGTCFFNNQSGWALPIDSTPGDYDSVNCNAGGRSYPNYALYNAQWNPGQTYTNGGFSVNVVSRTGSTFVVSTTGKAPPTVTGISPTGGDPGGGTLVTITGSDFVAGSTVSLGGVGATNVSVVNPTKITATTGAHAVETVDVVVTNTLGQTATITNGFTYTTAPVIITHPQSQSIVFGGSVSLNVVASAALPLTYQWYLGTGGDTSSPIGGATSSTYTTPSLTSTTEYWVRVTNSAGIANSNTATITFAFTDSTLIATVTLIKREHITELRTRIDALRLRYGGLPAYTYTVDPAITAGTTTIKAQHIIELRAALQPAYSTAKGSSPTYATDPTLVGGMSVKAGHITELRNFVLAIE